MTEDIKVNSNLKYLDDILKYLVQNASAYSVNFNTLYKYKFSRDFDEDNKEFDINIQRTLDNNLESLFDFSISDNNRAEAEKFYEALIFLNSENLIRIDNAWNIKITFEGIIEHGKGGLFKKYNSERYKNWFDRFNAYITIAISLLALVLGYFLG